MLVLATCLIHQIFWDFTLGFRQAQDLFYSKTMYSSDYFLEDMLSANDDLN